MFFLASFSRTIKALWRHEYTYDKGKVKARQMHDKGTIYAHQWNSISMHVYRLFMHDNHATTMHDDTIWSILLRLWSPTPYT